MLIDLVMATDMKQHFSIVSQFGALHRLNKQKVGSGECNPAILDSSDSDKAQKEAMNHPPGGGGGGPVLSSYASVRRMMARTPIDETERLLSLQVGGQVPSGMILMCMLGFRV